MPHCKVWCQRGAAKESMCCHRYMIVYQYGAAVLFNVEDHEVEVYLQAVRPHASGVFSDTEMRKDGEALLSIFIIEYVVFHTCVSIFHICCFAICQTLILSCWSTFSCLKNIFVVLLAAIWLESSDIISMTEAALVGLITNTRIEVWFELFTEETKFKFVNFQHPHISPPPPLSLSTLSRLLFYIISYLSVFSFYLPLFSLSFYLSLSLPSFIDLYQVDFKSMDSTNHFINQSWIQTRDFKFIDLKCMDF